MPLCVRARVCVWGWVGGWGGGERTGNGAICDSSHQSVVLVLHSYVVCTPALPCLALICGVYACAPLPCSNQLSGPLPDVGAGIFPGPLLTLDLSNNRLTGKTRAFV